MKTEIKQTQYQRYKKLVSFISENFKEDIDIKKVEAISLYSYRNINRIFTAIHNETIGKYINRLRLEKAAHYLFYSEMGISEIAYEVGYEDRAAFSKAFKVKFGYSPSAFKEKRIEEFTAHQISILESDGANREKLEFEIIHLPDFEYLFLEYRGEYENVDGLKKSWNDLVNFAYRKQLITSRSFFFTEIIDDTSISDNINSRYNLAISLDQRPSLELDGLFRIKKHNRQKYAQFTHQGSYQSCLDFYDRIFAYWILDVDLELVDLPIIEIYPNKSESLNGNSWQTEILVPVM